MNPLIQLKQTTSVFLVAFGLASFGLLPQVQAVSPPPDGCYPNFTTVEGCNALQSLTTGAGNTALGWRSLFSNATGNFNTGVGVGALVLNNGDSNTAVGAAALLLNTTGQQNTAIGTAALLNNNTGVANTAVGFLDTAVGPGITSGNLNVVVGTNAGAGIAAGLENVCIGAGAGGSANTGNENVYIGAGEDPPGPGIENNTIRIADNLSVAPAMQCFIGGIFGVTTSGGTAVFINSDGQLGTVVSSERFKNDIATMGKASEGILSLRPVTFHYKTDTKGTPQFGLIAEEVAEVNPNLVIYDADRKPYTVRYDAVNAMLLNEFLKEHKTVEQQDARLTKQEALIARQQKQIDALTAGLQKVSAQLEVSKTAPQTVLNN